MAVYPIRRGSAPSDPAGPHPSSEFEVPRAVLDTALRIIAQHGVGSLSVGALIADASLKRESLGNLDRQRLLVALLNDNRLVWNARVQGSLVQRLHGEFALFQLFNEISALFDETDVMRGRLRLVFELSHDKEPAIREALHRLQSGMRTGLAALLEDGIGSGHFESADVTSIAMLVNCACKGMAYQWLYDSQSVNVSSVLRELEIMLVRRLGKIE